MKFKPTNVYLILLVAIAAVLCGATRAAEPPGAPLTIERQGSFFVGGRLVTAAGTYDGTTSPAPPNPGQAFWVDQMYVQYQVPVNARKLPLILVHGGGGTGRVWESTPDGREGFQTIFLRRGYAVYIVDAPRGGRSGFAGFTGELGRLDEKQQIVPSTTFRPGRELAWTRWRLGPSYPEVFPVQAFPMAAVDQFLMHVRPVVSDDPEIVSKALVALLERIGPAILVTHSNAGLWGWLAAARSDKVRGVVSYEPGFVFPKDEMPAPVPLFKGTQASGSPVSAQEFTNLTKIPVQVVFGDNIPKTPVPDLAIDGRRASVATSTVFADALSKQGGRASVLLLPDVGLFGNSHFMYSDLNNVQVADQLSAFLEKHGLDMK